jgi:hypothetical protein
MIHKSQEKLFKINLKLFCKNYKGKTEKRKREINRKMRKGRGERFSPRPESAHGPASPASRTGTLPFSLLR